LIISYEKKTCILCLYLIFLVDKTTTASISSKLSNIGQPAYTEESSSCLKYFIPVLTTATDITKYNISFVTTIIITCKINASFVYIILFNEL